MVRPVSIVRQRLSLPALLGAAGCAVLVGLLALMHRGGVPAVDQTIEYHVHTWMVAHPPWAQTARVIGVVTDPWVVRAVVVAAMVALVHIGLRSAASWLFGTVAAGSIVVILLKLLFARPRPVWSDPIAIAQGFSFPSSHALNSAVAAGCVIVLLRLAGADSPSARRLIIAGRVGAPAFALITGVNRVLLGVHYPTDVLAGWMAGGGVVLLMLSVFPEPVPPPAPTTERLEGQSGTGPT